MLTLNNKLYRALSLMLLLIAIGTFGYKFLSDAYSWIEALYMTIITISTVGFGEVHPMGEVEKLFTIFLIITSISIYGYVVSVISEFIVNGRFFEQLKIKKMQQKIQKFHNHTIICGFGRNGKQAAEHLRSYNQLSVLIESDEKIIEEIEGLGYNYVKGNATDDKTLEKANIKDASYLITTLPSDADNLYVVLSARQMNKNLKIISRASNDTSYSKLKIAGADNIIMPDKIGGNHMASLIVTPDLVEFVERISIEGKQDTNLEEIAVNDLPKEFINKTLLDLDLRKRTGCLVIGYKDENNQYIVNPDVNVVLKPGNHLILLGNTAQIKKLREIF